MSPPKKTFFNFRELYKPVMSIIILKKTFVMCSVIIQGK